MSLIEELIELQRESNRQMAALTPAERAAVAREALRNMPGQAYLFGPNDEDDPETARPGQWEQS